MGGNAIKNTTTRRYGADEYFALVPEILARFQPRYTDFCDSAVIPAYRSKESFGDMDLLYSTTSDLPLGINEVELLFPQSKEIVRNGSVISLEYKELQIDLIHSPKCEYDYALSYFSFNDLGNLIGKIAHRFGLKHGHSGLYLPVRSENHLLGEILLTHDHDETLDFLGLSVNKFHIGFENLQEIFEYVSASPFYDPSTYKLENLNCIARIRDKKRDTYRKFLAFGESFTGNVIEFHKNKSDYLQDIFNTFPSRVRQEYDAIASKIAVRAMVAAKFNGDKVSEMTGLSSKQLGQFMKFLRADFYFEDSVIINLSQTDIDANILDRFAKFKETQ